MASKQGRQDCRAVGTGGLAGQQAEYTAEEAKSMRDVKFTW
jgi:hypothetical protein